MIIRKNGDNLNIGDIVSPDYTVATFIGGDEGLTEEAKLNFVNEHNIGTKLIELLPLSVFNGANISNIVSLLNELREVISEYEYNKYQISQIRS